MKVKRLAIPLILPVLGILLWLSALDVHAQSEYFLMPAIIYDGEPYSDPPGNAGGGFYSGANVLSTEGIGTCTYDGGWTYCGAAVAVQRPDGVDAVLGFVIDWYEAAVESQTHARPEAIGVDVSGQGSVFGGNSGCANVAACPSSYQARWCMTDVDPGDLTHLLCNEEPDIWLTDAVTGTNDSLAIYVVNTTGGTLDMSIVVELYWLVLECPSGYVPNEENICVEDEGPPPPPPVEFPTCSFSYTQTITTTTGTGTATYSYTVSANLIQNGSFEDADSGDYFPAHWTFSSDVPPLSNSWWGNSPLIAYSGHRYMDSYQQHQLYKLVQDLTLYSSGQYRAGFYARPSGHYLNAFGQVRMLWGGSVVAQSAIVTNTWQVFSGTRATGGGAAWLEMAYFSLVPGSNTDVYGDHAFIYPIDENGDILCSPEYYPVPPGQPITTTVPSGCAIQFGDVCFPQPEDSSCWNCQLPTNFFDIGRWITWLVCQVRNLFFCHLYSWILALANLVIGVFSNLFSFLSWLAGLPNTALDWLGDVWQNVVTWVGSAWQGIWTWAGTVFGNLLTSVRVFFHSLIQRLLEIDLVRVVYRFLEFQGILVQVFYRLLLWIVHLVEVLLTAIFTFVLVLWDLAVATFEALTTPAYDWSMVPGASPDGGFLPGDLGGDGPTPQKILWLFLLGLGTFDATLGDLGIAPFQFVVIGLMAFGLVMWTFKKWDQILTA